MIHEAAGGSTPKSAVNEPVALDWAGASNLNTCEDPHDIDTAFDRGEEHAGIAVIALVYNNPDTATVLPRVAKALASPRPETRRQGLLAMMHTARLHGCVDETTLGLLKELLDDRSPISGGYEVRGTAAQTVEDLQAFLPRQTLPNWVNDFTAAS